MKALVCEMCGCHDLLKQDGVFICQSCGTKYSVEEAKKMMVEGNVDVSGSTVKVDESSKIDNYLAMAESAYSSSNYKEAENYCNKILEIDPTNSKAWLIKGKAAGWQSTIAHPRIEESVTAFENAINNATDDVIDEVKEESANEALNLSMALIKLCCNNFAKNPSEHNEKNILTYMYLLSLNIVKLVLKCGKKMDKYKADIATILNTACVEAWTLAQREYAASTYPNDYDYREFKQRCFSFVKITKAAIDFSDKDDKEDKQRYLNLITYKFAIINACSYSYYNGGHYVNLSLTDEAKESNIDDIMEYHSKIKEIDPEYVIPVRPTLKKGGGCYVATCVYGSYNCPQVWTLRRYRDNTLAKTWYGRLFIRTYYAISPTIVKLFGHTEWFKRMWRGKLDRMVTDLQEKGVESTPYNDKRW